MQIILLKNVSNLGMIGDVVDVKNGYFRNFLGPRQLALEANASKIAVVEHQRKMVAAKMAKEKSSATDIKKKLEDKVFTLAHAAGSADRLFGSVTNQEIAQVIKEGGFEIDRRYITTEAPIKTLGDHVVTIKLHPEVSANVKLAVTRKAGSPEEKAEKPEKKKKEKAEKVEKAAEKPEEQTEKNA